jgi:ABC-type sugar transport system permease subunit
MKQHLDDLSEIRSLMERSSKFISLSGLSGIFAGSFALIGAYLAYIKLGEAFQNSSEQFLTISSPTVKFLAIDGALVLILSLLFAIYFTARQTKKKGLKIWDKTSKRLLLSMMIPLITGGLFCIILFQHAPQLIDSATLIFYGLALLNASKYTFDNVKYLGFAEILLGLICGMVNDWHLGLLFWAVGFGLCHIFYGIIMYREHKG